MKGEWHHRPSKIENYWKSFIFRFLFLGVFYLLFFYYSLIPHFMLSSIFFDECDYTPAKKKITQLIFSVWGQPNLQNISVGCMSALITSNRFNWIGNVWIWWPTKVCGVKWINVDNFSCLMFWVFLNLRKFRNKWKSLSQQLLEIVYVFVFTFSSNLHFLPRNV